MISDVTTETFQIDVLAAEEVCVLFGLCGDPGSFSAQQLLKISTIDAFFVDVDREPQITMKYDVRAAPSLFVFRKGMVALTLNGVEAITAYLNDYQRPV